MANNFIEHKDRWLLIANDEFEYSIHFIKAWLPFNAWYCNSYPSLENNDRRILTEIKTSNNLFKTRIISLLDGVDENSVLFKQKLVKLNNQLELCKVPSAASPISFKSINFRKNTTRVFNKTYRNHQFKIELITPIQPHNNKIKVDILNNHSSNILAYLHNKVDIQHLKNNNDFKNLSVTNQKIIIDGFELINPNLKESLIVNRKNQSITSIKEVFFINDTDLLAQGIIEILYNLRCILFHGEVNPSKDNLKIYEPAFYMLRLLIKSIE
jgi:hypothetical protein